MSVLLLRRSCARSRGWVLSVVVPGIFLVNEMAKRLRGAELPPQPPGRPVPAQSAVRSRYSSEPEASANIPPLARSDPKMTLAQKLYRHYCQRCHDEDGRGVRVRARMPQIPDFIKKSWQEKRSDGQFVASILGGKGTSMPAFGDKLSQDKARVLAAYVRALDPPGLGRVKPVQTDFERRFRQLQQEMEELRRQFKALTQPPKCSASRNDRQRRSPAPPSASLGISLTEVGERFAAGWPILTEGPQDFPVFRGSFFREGLVFFEPTLEHGDRGFAVHQTNRQMAVQKLKGQRLDGLPAPPSFEP